jgi:hypothetical protein
MTHEAFWLWLNNTILQARMSAEYFQTMAWWFSWVALFSNVVVVILFATSIWYVNYLRSKQRSLWYALVTGVPGIILLFFPFSSWQIAYEKWQCEWSSVASQLKDMETTFISLRKAEPLPAHLANQVQAVNARILQMEGQEPSAWGFLVEKCWGDQLERMYGRGLRTTQQVEAHLNQPGQPPPINQPLRPAPKKDATANRQNDLHR